MALIYGKFKPTMKKTKINSKNTYIKGRNYLLNTFSNWLNFSSSDTKTQTLTNTIMWGLSMSTHRPYGYIFHI